MVTDEEVEEGEVDKLVAEIRDEVTEVKLDSEEFHASCSCSLQ